MHAVIATGGKQYRISEGQKFKVESLALEVGESIEFDALMVSNGEKAVVGTPIVDGGKVKATVLSHGRGDKINIIKMRRRKHFMKHQGHRQNFTELKVESIKGL